MRSGSKRWIVGLIALLIAGWLLLRPSGSPVIAERGPLEAERTDAEIAAELDRLDASLVDSSDLPIPRVRPGSVRGLG